MSLGIKKFNWVRTPSAYQQMRAWRARQRDFTEKSISSGDMFNSVVAQAKADESKGLVKLATQAAVKRMQAAAKSKVDETIAGIDKVKLDMKI